MHENEPEFKRKIIMSDETYFDLGGYLNKQNCRIWGRKPQKKRLLLLLFWAGRIIAPYFLKMKLERLFRSMDCDTIRDTQVAKPSVFCVKSFQAK